MDEPELTDEEIDRELKTAGIDMERALERMRALVSRARSRCRVPPPGWSCSRQAGHEGPCAARPVSPIETDLY